MVKLKDRVQLAEALEPVEGATYEITGVDEVTTIVRGFKGIRVTMKSTNPKDKKQYATMLWFREVAGAQSKLGAFIRAFKEFFGDEEQALDTDNWIGHTIRFISWKPRNREVVVVE